MRYFERQPLDAAIQTQLDEKTSKNWHSLTEKQRKEIVKQLLVSQKALCSYCESKISDKKEEHHIEHFEERHDAPNKIFHYSNLLLSCEGGKNPMSKPESDSDALLRKSNISCGNGKEKGRHGNEIDYSLLLNPTEKGVDVLFSYRDGIVEPSKLCTVEQIEQVEYTKTRLNLNSINLKDNRKEQINQIILSLDVLSEELQKNYIRTLLDENQAELEPYFSTIKDNFSFLLLS